jgi:hypothetical protein
VVSPFDHAHDPPLLAVSVTESPSQNANGPSALTVTTGGGSTFTKIGAEVSEHPPPLLATTQYVPVVVTLMDCVVAPVDHSHEFAMFAFSVTDPPWQKVVGPFAVMLATGCAFTITATLDEVSLHALLLTATQ